MSDGCSRGINCPLCENTGQKCSATRAVYQATCELCQNVPLIKECAYSHVNDQSNSSPGHDESNSSPGRDESNSSPSCVESNSSPVHDESNSSPVCDESNSSPTYGGISSARVEEFNIPNLKCEVSTKGLYIGETSRQIGTRIEEHLNNLKLWNKESFMLLHWMTEHGASAEPPPFSYKTLATHGDALSRQLHEAVLIRTKGDLNRKYEFASNELVRLQSKGYSWQEQKEQRVLQQQELKLKSCIESFISVMKNVHNCNSKRKKTSNDEFYNCSRLRQAASGPHKTKKRRIMETSTPRYYREKPLLELEQSPVDPGSSMEISGQDTSEGTNASLGHRELESPTVKKAMERMKMTPNKLEDEVLTKAKLSITAIEHSDSDASFRKRVTSAPLGVRKPIIMEPKLGMDRSKSVGEIDFSSWNSDDSVGELSNDKKVYLESWVNDCGTYGLEYLFMDEVEKEDMNVQDLVINITKNKLHSIFLRSCTRPVKNYRAFNNMNKATPGVLVTPGKRKTSFLPDLAYTRPTKTACIREKGTSSRAHSVGGSPILKHGRREKTSRSRAFSTSGQQLLTKWYSKKSQDPNETSQ